MKISGYPSGDNESPCFDVSREDFIAAMGREPNWHERSMFHVKMYRIYYEQLLPFMFEKESLQIDGKEYRMKVELEIETSKDSDKSTILIKTKPLTPDPKDFINFDDIEELPLDFL